MNENSLADDVLRGASEIADFMGLPRRSIYHAVANGSLPTFRIGQGVYARRSTLKSWVASQESAPKVAA